MGKYVQNFWVRFLACLLCSVTLITGVAAGVFIAGLAVIGDEEEVYENGQEVIAENYAAYIYDHIYEIDGTEPEEFIKEVEDLLKDKNFTCSISKIPSVEVLNGIPQEKEEVPLYNNLGDVTDWDYQIEIEEGAYIHYNIESIRDAFRIRPVIDSCLYTVDAGVNEYVFDAENGLFYYCANGMYFLADYIMVAKDGTYYDYRLKNTEDGGKVYYNGFYDVTLDTSDYREWNWVQMGNNKLLFALDGYVSNEIQIMDEESILDKRYIGTYFFDESVNMISYYPEREVDIYIVRINVNDLTHVERISHDMFLEWQLVSEAFYENEVTYQTVLVISVLVFILSFALLIYSAKKDKEKIGFWNKIPVIIFSFAAGLSEVGLFALILILVEHGWYGYSILPFNIVVTLLIMLVFAMAMLAFIWLQNIITRFKTRTFIRYSEIHYAYQMIKWCWSKICLPFKAVVTIARENTKLFTRGLVIMLGISLIQIMTIAIFWWEMDVYLIIFFIAKMIEIPIVILILLQMQKLQEGSKRIAEGDLSHPIDTSKMFWEFKKHGENINKVSDGIALAVEDRMKSERFKTELITNVSHDIKTPLTSIINYVDLIKKEDVQDETLREYVDVLDRQSARLKKLIEDLMEASKASTGNLTVNMEDCDVDVLLTQLIGEFEEKLSANQLEVVVQKPEQPVIISADGRHMWRVLDNLLNNACKYSLPGTRVYISLVQVGNETTITFKNISKAALNIPSDELMERFVRGDSSRNTEGSGLGLSIAQSLTELMKGSMKLEIDGDLFKVILKFQGKIK